MPLLLKLIIQIVFRLNGGTGEFRTLESGTYQNTLADGGYFAVRRGLNYQQMVARYELVMQVHDQTVKVGFPLSMRGNLGVYVRHSVACILVGISSAMYKKGWWM